MHNLVTAQPSAVVETYLAAPCVHFLTPTHAGRSTEAAVQALATDTRHWEKGGTRPWQPISQSTIRRVENGAKPSLLADRGGGGGGGGGGGEGFFFFLFLKGGTTIKTAELGSVPTLKWAWCRVWTCVVRKSGATRPAKWGWGHISCGLTYLPTSPLTGAYTPPPPPPDPFALPPSPQLQSVGLSTFEVAPRCAPRHR